MIEIIKFKDRIYPKFQASHNMARFATPFAKEVCNGIGLDVGPGKLEWCFPGAIPIDLQIPNGFNYSAMNLPSIKDGYDYIFSSHCLEHINEPWYSVLNYWLENLKVGGTMFLYLPHPNQEYWSPWYDTRHVHILHPKDIRRYFKSESYCNIFVSKQDICHSFIAMAQKK